MDNTEFAVPVFHAYGHVLEYQVPCICIVSYSHLFFQNKFNPRNVTGFGLSDGEGVERPVGVPEKFHIHDKRDAPITSCRCTE